MIEIWSTVFTACTTDTLRQKLLDVLFVPMETHRKNCMFLSQFLNFDARRRNIGLHYQILYTFKYRPIALSAVAKCGEERKSVGNMSHFVKNDKNISWGNSPNIHHIFKTVWDMEMRFFSLLLAENKQQLHITFNDGGCNISFCACEKCHRSPFRMMT